MVGRSGSTGERFPADPAEVRELAVNHWVSPVEFTKLIETMHADGIRLFVPDFAQLATDRVSLPGYFFA